MNPINGTHSTSEIHTSDDSSGRPLTDNQERVLYILNTLAGSASMLGSFLVLKIVRNSKRKKGSLSVYDRLLVGLSISDFFASAFCWILGSYLMPKGDRVWAFGNETTCNITGFFAASVTVSLFYSSMISLYYALLVRYGFRDDQLKGKIECSMHLVSILWPLLSYIVVMVLDAFGPRLIGLNCFLSDYPKGCVDVAKDTELEEGEVRCRNDVTNILTSGLQVTIGGLLIVICNLIIFCHVRTSMRLHQEKAFARQKGVSRSRSRNPATEESSSNITQTRNAKPNMGRRSFFRFGLLKELSSSSKELTREIMNQDNQMQQVRAVMNQSLFYVGAVVIVNLPLVTQIGVGGNPSVTRENESTVFVLLCFTTFLSPLQGIFNLMVFCRPTYLRMRRSFPSDSRLQSFLKTIEAGTSDSRGGKNRRFSVQSQLQPLREPREPICKSCKGWKRLIRKCCGSLFCKKGGPWNSKPDANATEHQPSPGQSERLTSNRFRVENDDSMCSKGMDRSRLEDGERKAIQLEMMDGSSSSLSSSSLSKSQVNTTDTNEQNRASTSLDIDDDGEVRSDLYQDWHNVEFESSCVAFFSSTTSTIAA